MNLPKSGWTDCKQRQQTDYNEYDRRLNYAFIHGLDDEGMISEILRKVSVLEDIDDATSEWVLSLAKRVEDRE